jgi:hypothetical protein
MIVAGGWLMAICIFKMFSYIWCIMLLLNYITQQQKMVSLFIGFLQFIAQLKAKPSVTPILLHTDTQTHTSKPLNSFLPALLALRVAHVAHAMGSILANLPFLAYKSPYMGSQVPPLAYKSPYMGSQVPPLAYKSPHMGSQVPPLAYKNPHMRSQIPPLVLILQQKIC